MGNVTAQPAWDSAKLAKIRDIQHGVLYQHGIEIAAWGNADEVLRNWASTARSVVASTVWGVALTNGDVPGGLAALDQPVQRLGTPTALTFASDVLLAHPLSYTDPRKGWHYSQGWVPGAALFREVVGIPMHDYFNSFVSPTLTGIHAVVNDADGTPRFFASCRNAAKWAALFMDGGGDLIAHQYVERALGGGPYGDGSPNTVEGFQIHLSKNGHAWEVDTPGTPFFFMGRDGSEYEDHGHGVVLGCPSLDLVFAYRGGNVTRVLPALFGAMN